MEQLDPIAKAVLACVDVVYQVRDLFRGVLTISLKRSCRIWTNKITARKSYSIWLKTWRQH